MFDEVQNNGGRAECQNNPREFEIMRSSQLKTWSEDVLKSYLHDLTSAAYSKRNLLTEKYAYMMESTYPEEFAQRMSDKRCPLCWSADGLWPAGWDIFLLLLSANLN